MSIRICDVCGKDSDPSAGKVWSCVLTEVVDSNTIIKDGSFLSNSRTHITTTKYRYVSDVTIFGCIQCARKEVQKTNRTFITLPIVFFVDVFAFIWCCRHIRYGEHMLGILLVLGILGVIFFCSFFDCFSADPWKSVRKMAEDKYLQTMQNRFPYKNKVRLSLFDKDSWAKLKWNI